MLKAAFLALVTLAIAIGGGAASVSWMLENAPLGAGTWAPHANPTLAEADPYVRAQLSRTGGLTLGRAEGLSFVAERDDAGDPLSGNCEYQIEGPLPAARFWTLWAGDEALRPVAGRGQRSAMLNALQTLRPPEGGMRVTASAAPRPGNWLLVGQGRFALVLTLYDAPAAGFQGGLAPALPRIVRTRCAA